MAKHSVSGTFGSAYLVETSDDRWVFTRGFRSNSDEHGVFVEATAPGATIEMLGRINVPQRGIFSEADDTEVIIGKTGMMSGNMLGVSVEGDNGMIVNHGAVKSGNGSAVHWFGTGTEFHNFSDVSAVTGVQGLGTGTVIVNGKSGQITGSTNGIYLISMGGDETQTTNHGNVKGGVYAYFGSDGDDTLINRGRMEGKVTLGNGHDVFDTRGGKLISMRNEVAGGIGDDTLITDDRKYMLKEAVAEGIDTVKSTVSHTLADNVERLVLLGKKNLQGEGSDTDNGLHGNRGNNFLDGDAGDDHLSGHAGDDQLRGGEGLDTFHFSTGDGRDVITDFEHGEDRIDLSNWDAVDDFERFLSHAFERNGDVIIKSGADSLRIWDVTLNDLDDGDFIFPL